MKYTMICKLFFAVLLLCSAALCQVFPTISNLQLRYEADCVTFSSSCAVPSDGTNLTTWHDQSGNARDATVSSGTCTFHTNQIHSTLPTITFSSCHMDFTGIDTHLAATMFVMGKVTTTASINELITGDGQSMAYLFGLNVSGHNREETTTKDNFADVQEGIASSDTNFHQMNSENLSSGTLDQRLDCAADGSRGGVSFGGTNTTGLGRDKPDGGNAFAYTGQVAAIIIYNRKLNSTEIGQVESYLATKYGATGSCIANTNHRRAQVIEQ